MFVLSQIFKVKGASLDQKDIAKHGVPLQISDEKSGVDCVRKVEKIA
jgi:hypothetical protein